MAEPIPADRMVQILRAEGCKVVEVRSWRTHNRNHKGPWGPVHGVMIHHTVSRGEPDTVELCYDGHSTLPGPLCHGVIGKSGTVYLVGNGRTNHAGGGDPDVLAAVKNESYGTRPPVPDVGNVDGVDGNRHFYGFECENMGDGKDPWPAAQRDAIVRASAAICRYYGWTAKSVIGHAEWSDDKSDPRGPAASRVTPPELRADIAERLKHPASWNPQPNPTTPGGEVTTPSRTTLSRTEDVQLIPGSPYTVYWSGEYRDDANEHGDGGKTVLTTGRYTATLNLSLPAGALVDVYPIEEDASGNQTGAGVPVRVEGNGGFVAVPFTGHANERLAFQVKNVGAQTATLSEAWAFLLHWPV